MQGRASGTILGVILGVIFLILLIWSDQLTQLPAAYSTYAKEIDTLFYVIYYVTGFVFVLVTVLLFGFAIRYRQQPGRSAVYTHGSTTLELIWTIIPATVFLLLFLVGQATWAKVKMFPPQGDVEVRLIAKQFAWEFHYPGPDGKFDTADDLQIDGELHVPVHKKVRVYLRGTDVIHSFFVPVLRLKQDILPGREIPAWFEATATGRFEIPCAELCGPGHSGMKGWLTVHSAEDYEKWVQKQWPS